MKKVLYTIIIPDETDIESVVINLKHKSETRVQRKHDQVAKRDSNIQIKHEMTDEPDEGLLYDELY